MLTICGLYIIPIGWNIDVREKTNEIFESEKNLEH